MNEQDKKKVMYFANLVMLQAVSRVREHWRSPEEPTARQLFDALYNELRIMSIEFFAAGE